MTFISGAGEDIVEIDSFLHANVRACAHLAQLHDLHEGDLAPTDVDAGYLACLRACVLGGLQVGWG